MQTVTSAKIALERTIHYSSCTEHLKLRPYMRLVTTCYKMFLAQCIVNKGNGYETRQTSKEQTKILRFSFGRSTTSQNLFCCADTLCMNYVTNTFYWFVPQYGVNNYCVLCKVKPKKANKNIQQRTLSGFITILLYNCAQWQFISDGKMIPRRSNTL